MPIRSRDRCLQILQRRGDGLVAYDALGGMGEIIDSAVSDPDWREYFRSGDLRYINLEPARGEREVFAEYIPDLPDAADLSCWGVGRMALQSAEGYHAGHKYWHPLAGRDTLADLDAYPWPDVSRVMTPEALRAEVAGLQAEGFTVIGQMSQTILETAYLMRGIDQLMVDFYERPDYVEALFTRLGEQRVIQARMFGEAGVDTIRIGDDIATQEALIVSLPMYRRFIKPHHAASIAAAHSALPGMPVEYHSDGNLTALLPDLIEIGVTSINPVQPECMDLLETRRQFGRDLTLWGCTPVQSTYAYGTQEDIRAHTRFLFEEVARDHGIIIQFMNIVITPRVLENLGAFFEEYARCGGG